jgi:dTDP-4-dehydrorhamnose 3,5-epimerase
MEFKELQIKGVFEIELTPHADHRGFFMRTFDHEVFEKAGLRKNWVQENHSRSEKKYTLRGLHFQFPPFCEAKLVRCIRGAILDVFVDLRAGSETFGKWNSITLSENNHKMILIPRGLAHGFCTLTDECEVLYKVDNLYSKEHESGIIWNDPELNIEWPVREPVISLKDQHNSTFREFRIRHNAISGFNANPDRMKS